MSLFPHARGARHYAVGEQFSFGMTLIGTMVQFLPYILLSVKQLEVEGIGRHLDENQGRRGRFRVELVECYHPFTGQRQTLYAVDDISDENYYYPSKLIESQQEDLPMVVQKNTITPYGPSQRTRLSSIKVFFL